MCLTANHLIYLHNYSNDAVSENIDANLLIGQEGASLTSLVYAKCTF